jgi:hypothetical protein
VSQQGSPELPAKLEELARLRDEFNSVALRMGAYFELHKAASLKGDPQEMQQRRDELHTVLDVSLDTTEHFQRLCREAGLRPDGNPY